MSEREWTIGDSMNDLIVTMQAAWIEWKYGRGADAAMLWIENSLDGPGSIPDPDEPYATEAQAWYDLNRAHPWPPCVVCGRPTHIMSGGVAWCSPEHERQHKASDPRGPALTTQEAEDA